MLVRLVLARPFFYITRPGFFLAIFLIRGCEHVAVLQYIIFIRLVSFAQFVLSARLRIPGGPLTLANLPRMLFGAHATFVSMYLGLSFHFARSFNACILRNISAR